MQRVAAIYDIHGNLPALEAVLDELPATGADAIVVGGDILPGPMPKECLDRLFGTRLPMHFIHGNGESAALQAFAGGGLENIPEAFRPAIQWSAEQLPDEYRKAITRWPLTLRIEIEALGEVLFCHATARNDTELITRLSPDERIREVFPGFERIVAVCGHTHMQFDRTVDTLRVVNAGSVGMPFGDPGAHWLLLGPEIEFRRTLYDVEAGAARLRASAFPDVSGFIERQVLNRPSEEQILAAYAKADGRSTQS
jgi:diadenosine tetraphosphatase ApaH/serine/threonine PP2A family protein phosphatase